MQPPPHEKAEAIVRRALALEPHERIAFIDEACANDTVLRAEVENLLFESEAHAESQHLTAAGGPSDTLKPGDLLAGRFRIARLLGRGGMGEVYQADDLELGGSVALKTILTKLIPDPRFLGRFRREVQLARQVTHPNICRIFDVGRAELGSAEMLYFTMEYLEGEPLSAHIRRKGRLTTGAALTLIRQITAALDALHAQGIVHRDIKPANIMVVSTTGGEQRAVIGDFGLARALADNEGEETLTHTGHILGTPEYMAPEQLFGKPVTPAADIYSLGLVIYEMVTGARAFPGSRGLGNAMRRATEKPASPRELAPELPEHWASVILQCLDTEPDRRPPSAEAVTAALAGNPALTQSVVVTPRRPRRVWAWILAAAVLTIFLSIFTAPVRSFFGGKSPAAASYSTHDDYLKALDLLNHSYRPRSVGTALAALQKIVAADPEFALAHAALAQAYWLSHRERSSQAMVDKAKASCATALKLDNRLAPPHVTRGRIYTESAQFALAAQEIQTALKLDPQSAEAYGAQAELFDRQGRETEVEPTLQKAMDLAPEDWRWPNLLGIHYLNNGDFERAAGKFEKLTQIAPDNVFALNNLGGSLMRLGRFQDAQAAYEKSLAIVPRAQVINSLCAALMFQGKAADAIDLAKESTRLDPSSHRSWGNLAAAYLWSGNRKEALINYREAIAAAEKVRKTSPSNAQLLADLAGYYAELSDAGASIPLLRQAAIRDPANPNVLFRIGETYEVLNRRALALEFVGKALERGYPPEFVRRNPELQNLRADPKFQSLFKR